MNKKTTILIVFIILKMAFQYILIAPGYDLHRDEYLYLDQANHPAWGYMSVPPFTSWVAWIIKMLGNSVFWVKFFPALFGALTMVVVWKAIEALRGDLFALILGAVCVLFSALPRLNILFQPNSFDILCWTAFYFILIRYIQTKNSKWLFFGAVVVGLGLLNKYNILFMLMGLFPALLISKHRSIFLLKKFYLSLLLGMVLILPNLLWQYFNDFPVIHHMEELSATQLVHVERIAFLKSQIFFFLGSLFVIAMAIYALLFYRPFKPFRFFVWTLIFTLAAFTYFRAKDYYAIGLYPVYLAFGSVYLSVLLKNGWLRYLRPVAISIPLLVFIPMYQYLFPNKSPEYIVAHGEKYKEMGMLRWEDGREHLLPQDFADMLGWKELALKVDSAWLTLNEPNKTLVFTDNYGQAGASNYYTNAGIQAVSFNADYINWFDFSKEYTNLIRVIEREDVQKEFKELQSFFDTAWIAGTITNPFARASGTSIAVFQGAKISINKVIKEEIRLLRRKK